MVNGRDYNSFMLQDPSILKLQAVNRTFSGDSKYISWHDPKEYYEDVKIFGEDLALYWLENDVENGGLIISNRALTSTEVITNTLVPLLSSADFYNIIVDEFAKVDRSLNDLRYTFTAAETSSIGAALDNAATSANPQVDLYFSATSPTESPVADIAWTVDANPTYDSIFMIRVEAQFSASRLSGWTIRWRTRRMNAQSQTTKFRHTNTATNVVNFNTLSSNDDNILVLAANLDGNKTGMVGTNKSYNVLGQELIVQNLPNSGVPDDNRLSVLPTDTDDDGIPNNIPQLDLLNATMTQTADADFTEVTFTLPSMYYMLGTEAESVIVTVDGVVYPFSAVVDGGKWLLPLAGSPVAFTGSPQLPLLVGSPTPTLPNELTSLIVNGTTAGQTIEVSTKQFVYFNRATSTGDWVPMDDTSTNRAFWYSDLVNTTHLYKREYGRYPLNFAWFYTTPRLHLVDPAPSNIIDTFIITRAYYQGLATLVGK